MSFWGSAEYKYDCLPVVELATTNEGSIAIATANSLDGEVHCGQTRAARCVNRDGRTEQVQVVRNPVGDHARRTRKRAACFEFILKEGTVNFETMGASRWIEQTHNISDVGHVKVNGGHVASNILGPVVDTGVEQRKEGELKELASADGQGTCILLGDTKLDVIEEVDVLEERAFLGLDLTETLALVSGRGGPLLDDN